MDHQERAGAAIRLVVGVGESSVDGEVIIGVGIHQPGRDRIEALRGLTVTLPDFWSKLARPAADRIDFQQIETAAGVLLPDFEFRLFLENAHQDRRILRHALLVEERQHLRRQFLHRAGGQLIDVVCIAAGKRHRAGEKRRHQKRAGGERAYKGGADQFNTPRLMDNPRAITYPIVILKRWLSQGRLAGPTG